MFCDLVGSTALSARLDPEDLRHVLAAYQRHATGIVEAAGGRVARYEGDGILAYFGYPVASEDDAERAVRAGLELAQGIAESAAGERLSVRVGIASGVVVVGELVRSNAADNPPVVGNTPNLAARLQTLAEPEGVLIAETTRRLTRGLFEYRDGGARRLQGFAEPVQVWHVTGTKGTTRFRALRSQSLPLIGRDAAMATLLDQWAAAAEGAGRAVLISGEPGIGKSRLAQELVGHARRRRATVLHFQCSPHHESSMLHPLLERLRRALLRRPAGKRADGRAWLRTLLPGRDAATDAAVALLAELMARPTAARTGAPPPDAQRKRALLLEALIGTLRQLTRDRPLLLVLGDAHWIDPTSRQLLDLIVERVDAKGKSRVESEAQPWAMLLAVTCRPEFQPGWASRVPSIELRPLADADAKALVRHIPGGESLAEAVVQGIVARADGVPLFVEELTKAVVEAARPGSVPPVGVSPADPVIPASLHASLTARLDRIGQPRETARIAAALGRELSFELLSAVVPDRNAEALRHDMQALAAADLLVPVASPAPETYAFRHALIQDAAYGTLLRSERRVLHERIARVLQERFPEVADTEPEIVAGHFTKAELWEPAARCWLRAGRRAVRAWALTEAVTHLTEGIRVAGLLPPSPGRQRLELDLNMALGPVMMSISGYASEATLEVYRRAEALVQDAGNVTERLSAMYGLFNVHFGRAELAEALAVATAYCKLAERCGLNLGRAYGLLAQTHAATGAFAEAERGFQRSLEVYARTPEEGSTLIAASQHVVSLALSAGVHSALGRGDECRAAIAQAVALAEKIEHPFSIALAQVTDLLTPIPGGLDADLARAESTVRLCAERGFRNFEAWARLARGAIIARRGDPRAGIAAMRAAIDAAESMSARLFRPIQLGALAAAHAKLGETDTALSLLDEAVATAARTGERRADAALHRLRGELLSAAGKRARGMRALQQAIDVARSQHHTAEEARIARAIVRIEQARPAALHKMWSAPLAALRAIFIRIAS